MVGRAGAAAVAVALLAGCGGGGSKTTPTSTTPGGDVAVLNAALDRQNTQIAAYTAATTALRGRAAVTGRAFLRAAQVHADALAQAVDKLGGTPHQPAPSYVGVLHGAVGSKAVVAVLARLERSSAAADALAVGRLADPDLQKTLRNIKADEVREAAALTTLTS